MKMRIVSYSKTIYVEPLVIEGKQIPGKFNCNFHIIPDHYSHSGDTFMSMVRELRKDILCVSLSEVHFNTITESNQSKFQPLLTYTANLSERQLQKLRNNGWHSVNGRPEYRY